MDKHYKALTVKLSPSAHSGLSSWCRDRGVSITGAIEAVGEVLQSGGLDALSEAELLERARRIDAERRSRRAR